MLGFDLMENFRTPYRSASIREFWSRWHISLSTWFRDYLYIPLGGNRVLKWRWYFNLFVVFLISGLWHGANWTFVLWGALHGAYLVLALVFAPFWRQAERKLGVHRIPRTWRFLNVLVTGLLVLFSWMLFRANDIGDIGVMLARILDLRPDPGGLHALFIELRSDVMIVTCGLALFFFLADPWADRFAKGEARSPGRWAEYGWYGLLLAATLLFGQYGRTEFIYFQF